LRRWVGEAEVDAGERNDRLTSGERERSEELEREKRELWARCAIGMRLAAVCGTPSP